MTSQRTYPELPTLEKGITLLQSDERATGALQSLVLDRVLSDDGPAVWVDSHGHGTTEPLARLAPSMRVLDRIDIARAFTPWQHFSLLQDLTRTLRDPASIVVLPGFDWFYRSDDLAGIDGERMLSSGLTLVSDLQEDHDVPVLITRYGRDDFSDPVAEIADDIVECELTTFGPRFAGSDFETLVYPIDEEFVQTTLTFWSRVLADRHPMSTTAAVSPEVNILGSH